MVWQTNQGYYNCMWRTLSTAYIKGIGKTVILGQALFSLLRYKFFDCVQWMVPSDTCHRDKFNPTTLHSIVRALVTIVCTFITYLLTWTKNWTLKTELFTFSIHRLCLFTIETSLHHLGYNWILNETQLPKTTANFETKLLFCLFTENKIAFRFLFFY